MRTNTKSFLNRTTALSATAITAFIASMVIAQADDVTVNSAETAKRTLSDGDNLIIEAGGSVSVVGDSAIVDSANGITVSINNAGSISADTGQSIDLTGSNISTFTNTGTINSTSPGNNPPNYMLVASEITNFINSGSMTSASASGISTTGDMGSFINNEGATINSNQFSAISVSGSLNSFYNAGSIIADESGTYNAIGLQVGLGGISSFTNTATGLIRSNAYGVFTFYDVGTFNNYGDIEGGFYPAVRIGGNVTELTNHADASITSGSITVRISGVVDNLINAGTISTSATIQAIEIGTGNITNTGTISGKSGINITRQYVTGDAKVTNSGIIKAANSSDDAIKFQGTGADTLKLESGSQITGQIDWDGVDDTLIYDAGLSSSVTFTNTPDNIQQNANIIVVTGNTVVQADTSSVAILDDAVSDVASAASAQVNVRVGGSSFQAGGSSAGNSSDGGSSSDEEGFGYGVISELAKRSAWISAWGAGSFQAASSTMANTTAYSGGLLGGIDWLGSDDRLFGFHGGAGLGNIAVNVTDGQVTDTRTYFGGFYGREFIDDIAVDYNFTAGFLQFKSDRRISTSSGTETANSKFNGYFIQPGFKFSKEITFGVKDLIPSIGAGYKGVFLDGYTETGASSNLTIETRDVHFLLANTQVDMIADFKTATGQTISFRPYIGMEGSFAIGTNTATASLSGASSSFNTGGDRNILRGYVGANFAKAIDETTKLFGGAEVSYNTSETTAFNVRLGLSKTF